MKTIGLQLKTKLNLRILVSFIFMGFISFSFAATITSNGSGNWNVPSSWVGNVVPGAGDAVIIANGHTITNNTVITCNSLTINSGGILRASNNFTVNTTTSITGTISNYGSGLKTFTGAVTINSGGSFINESTGNITFSNTVTINSGGTWSGSGTTGNTITLSGAFTNNSSAQTDNSTATYNTANNSNIKNFGLGLSVYNLTSTGVNTTHSGIFTVRNILSTGQFKMGANAILYFSGSNFTSTGDWVGCSNTSTLYMNGSNQTLPGTNYTCKIVIDNNQTVTVGNALTINTSLTVKTGSTFFDGNKSISFISANQLILESGSTFKLSSGNFPNNFTSNTQTGINANSTIELSGTSKIYQTGNTGWLPYAGNITLSGTTTLTHSIGNILVINGNLTINNGCILNFSNIGTITLKGNLTNNGSFTSANNSANRLVLTSGSRVHEISGTGTYATNGINTCIQLNDAFGAQINSGTIITIPTFTQTNGTFTNKGTLTITNAYTLPAANNFIADEGTTTTFNNTILNSGTFKVLCGTNTTIVGVFTNNGTITGPTIIGKWARIINSNAIVGTGSISANSYIAFSKTVTCIKTGSFIEENSSRFSTCVIITTFYSKNNTDLSIPSNWNSAIDGTGLNATTFTSITDTFIVQTQHISTINSNLNIAGTMIVNGTIIPNPTVIISGGTLTGSGNINVTRNIATADFLSQYTETNKILSNLTVEYSNPTGGQTISDVTYGNLKLSNTSGTQIAAGDITITDSLILQILINTHFKNLSSSLYENL